MTSENTQNRVVSCDSESLILVDKNNKIVGHKDKASCHKGIGLLHRAFSIFIFNSEGQLLLQKRSSTKQLWPLYWSNSCCSHPRKDESTPVAASRRLQQELGMQSELRYLYKFQYHEQYDAHGAENELCSVFIGSSDDPILENHHEISDWRFIKPNQLTDEIAKSPDQFTPWLKLEWEYINKHHKDVLQDYLPCPKGESVSL